MNFCAFPRFNENKVVAPGQLYIFTLFIWLQNALMPIIPRLILVAFLLGENFDRIFPFKMKQESPIGSPNGLRNKRKLRIKLGKNWRELPLIKMNPNTKQFV